MAAADPGHEIEDRLGWRDRKAVLAAGLVALALAAGILALFGAVAETSRATALEGLNQSVYWLAGATIGGCATIAALMLTTLTLMPHLETRRLTPRFLYHLRLTVIGALVTIALAVLDLLLTVFPAAGTERFTPSQAEVNTLYFATLAVTALTVGGFAVVLAALYQTIAEVFGHLPRAWLEDILAEDDGGAAENEAEGAEEGGGDADRAIVATRQHEVGPPGVTVDEVAEGRVQHAGGRRRARDTAGGQRGALPGDGRAASDHRTRRKTEA